MSKERQHLTGGEQVVVTTGAMLATVGLAASVWGFGGWQTARGYKADDNDMCMHGTATACVQLAEDDQEIAESKQLLGDGLLLLAIGGASVLLVNRRAQSPESANSVRLPFEIEFYRLIEGSLEQAPGIPKEPSKNQLEG